MKNRWLLLTIVMLAMMFSYSNHHVRAANHIEYKQIYCEDADAEKTLNNWAAQGWELAAVMFTEGHQHSFILRKSQ